MATIVNKVYSPEAVTNLSCVPPRTMGPFSDHGLLFFDFEVHAKSSTRDARTVFDYSLADWNGLAETLSGLDLSPADISNHDIDSAWERWSVTLLSAAATHIPTKHLKRRNTPPPSPHG